MSTLARTERAALCDLALEVGPNAPTLSGAWTVRELVAHLVLREASPTAVGIVLPPLARLTDAATARLAARRDFAELVERVRSGPPVYSPFRIPAVDTALNALEYFVHHEDIRRAQPDWEPRQLDDRAQRTLWKAIRIGGKRLSRSAPVGLVLERTDTGDRVVLKDAATPVVVRGLPAELVLFTYGRKAQSRVELVGDDAAVRALKDSDLGI